MAYLLLKWEPFCTGQGHNKTATLADFSHATTEEMGNRFLSNIDVGMAGLYPFSGGFHEKQYPQPKLGLARGVRGATLPGAGGCP